MSYPSYFPYSPYLHHSTYSLTRVLYLFVLCPLFPSLSFLPLLLDHSSILIMSYTPNYSYSPYSPYSTYSLTIVLYLYVLCPLFPSLPFLPLLHLLLDHSSILIMSYAPYSPYSPYSHYSTYSLTIVLYL